MEHFFSGEMIFYEYFLSFFFKKRTFIIRFFKKKIEVNNFRLKGDVRISSDFSPSSWLPSFLLAPQPAAAVSLPRAIFFFILG